MLFSNESKYRVEIDFHGKHKQHGRFLSYRNGFTSFLFVLIISTVWMWEPWFVAGQLYVQGFLSSLLAVFCWQTLRSPPVKGNMVLSVSAFGHCQMMMVSKAAAGSSSRQKYSDINELLAFTWQVTRRSRILPGMLWLQLKSGNRTKSWWLFPDEVDDKDFRRLCLVVRYCQKQA